MSLKACIDIISTGSECWIQIPNGDLETAISDCTEGKDYEISIVVGLKKDGFTTFPNNVFHKCDIFKLNNLIVELEEFHHFSSNDIENLAVLNLLLDNRNCDVDEVGDILRGERFRIFSNVDGIEDIAKEYLEESSLWYQQAKKEFPEFDHYFDFKHYGEERLDGILLDKVNKIAVEVFE